MADTIKTQFNLVSSFLSRGYLLFLRRVVLKLFIRPDIAIRCTLNTMKPSPEQVIANYLQGSYLLGKYHKNEPAWTSTSERAVITPETAHIRKRLRQYMKRGMFEIKMDTRFDDVIRSCQREKRTWINESVIDIYTRLHSMGWARSIEAFRDGELAGGLWGLKVGRTFSIMSMFHNENHAGSVVLGALVKNLLDGKLDLIDCHLMNQNFEHYGARPIAPGVFIQQVIRGMAARDSVKSNGVNKPGRSADFSRPNPANGNQAAGRPGSSQVKRSK